MGTAAAGLVWLGDQVTDRTDGRNPLSDPAKSIWADARVPGEVRGLLERSCADCHSNQVRWPSLSRLPVVARIFEDDVAHARQQMNLSHWESLRNGNPEDVQGILNGVCEETRIQNMPPRRYTLMHPQNVVTPKESELLCRWAESFAGSPPASASAKTQANLHPANKSVNNLRSSE